MFNCIYFQNRHFESFTRTLERLPLCLENLVLKHFHEKLDEYHRNILVKVVMEYLDLKSLPVFQGYAFNTSLIIIH